METTLSHFGIDLNAVDVSEVFSPSRFRDEAPKLSLLPSTAFDLRTGWDLNDEGQRRRCLATLREEDPYLVIGPHGVQQCLSYGT